MKLPESPGGPLEAPMGQGCLSIHAIALGMH